MLILSRKKNQQIVIGNNVVVTVVWIRGDRVGLGFEAPRDVAIDREEARGAFEAVRNAGKKERNPPAQAESQVHPEAVKGAKGDFPPSFIVKDGSNFP